MAEEAFCKKNENQAFTVIWFTTFSSSNLHKTFPKDTWQHWTSSSWLVDSGIQLSRILTKQKHRPCKKTNNYLKPPNAYWRPGNWQLENQQPYWTRREVQILTPAMGYPKRHPQIPEKAWSICMPVLHYTLSATAQYHTPQYILNHDSNTVSSPSTELIFLTLLLWWPTTFFELLQTKPTTIIPQQHIQNDYFLSRLSQLPRSQVLMAVQDLALAVGDLQSQVKFSIFEAAVGPRSFGIILNYWWTWNVKR